MEGQPQPSPISHNWSKRFTRIVIVTGILLIFAAFHLEWKSRDYLAKGVALETKGNLTDAIEQYEWALTAYTPLAIGSTEALNNLERIAEMAEQAGDDKINRSARQAIVSGLTMIHHFRQPYATQLENVRTRLDQVETRMIQDRQDGS
jgi:hypothetical protein